MSFQQRNYPRVEVHIPCKVRIDNNTLRNAQCWNISIGGMCISVADIVHVHQQGHITLLFEDESGTFTFDADFSVQWAAISDNHEKESRFGIQFISCDSTNSVNLARIIVHALSHSNNNQSL